jgi:hypothetical protein
VFSLLIDEVEQGLNLKRQKEGQDFYHFRIIYHAFEKAKVLKKKFMKNK